MLTLLLTAVAREPHTATAHPMAGVAFIAIVIATIVIGGLLAQRLRPVSR